MDSGSFNATVLAHYYLMAEGSSLNAVTYAATGVDFVAMESTINQTIAATVTVSVSSMFIPSCTCSALFEPAVPGKVGADIMLQTCVDNDVSGVSAGQPVE